MASMDPPPVGDPPWGAEGGAGWVTAGPTPIVIRHRTRLLLLGLGLLALAFVIWRVPQVFTVAVGGGALALVLSYPVRLLTRVMPRRLAVLLTLLGVLVLGVAAVLVLLPLLLDQLRGFVDDLPRIADRADRQLRDFVRDLEDGGVLPPDSDNIIRNIQQGILTRATVVADDLLTGLLGTITRGLGLVVQFLGILFVAVYLLLDADKLRRRFTLAAPAAYRNDALELWGDLGRSLSRYLGGLVVICSVQGVVAGTGLLLLGVPYALLIGVWTALTAVIPYIGAWAGAAPALLLAYLESPQKALLVAVLYFGMNTLEGNILTPRIQGQAVRVHPVLVLLTVLASGGMFGLFGVILAIPTLAMVRVIVEFFRLRLRVEG